jgi:hypothetical protein
MTITALDVAAYLFLVICAAIPLALVINRFSARRKFRVFEDAMSWQDRIPDPFPTTGSLSMPDNVSTLPKRKARQ